MTKQEILDQLSRAGVTDLDSLADLIVREAHPDGDSSQPVANAVIIYNHGFVQH